MLNSIKIFLLAILIVSCEQEPFETEVQTNPDLYKLFSQVYAPTNGDTKYLYLLYKTEEDVTTAEDKLVIAWSNFVVYADTVNMPVTGEEFMNDANTLNSFADAIVISTLQYATQQLRIDYQVDDTWNKFLIPYNINIFINAGDDITIIN
jgi:hypothetical protein